MKDSLLSFFPQGAAVSSSPAEAAEGGVRRG